MTIMTIQQYRALLTAFANSVLSDPQIENSIDAFVSGNDSDEGALYELTHYDEEYALWLTDGV